MYVTVQQIQITVANNMFNLGVVILMENRKLENIEGKKVQKEKN